MRPAFVRQSVVLAMVAVALFTCAGAALAGEERDLTGIYTAQGVGVAGARYDAKVTLARRGDTYLIGWQFTDGQFTGVGIRHGDVLSVGWSNNGKAGVVLYTIKDNTLDGVWADGSTDGRTYTETLTRRD